MTPEDLDGVMMDWWDTSLERKSAERAQKVSGIPMSSKIEVSETQMDAATSDIPIQPPDLIQDIKVEQ